MNQLRPFQRAGVEYILGAGRAYVADEMGLGKTVQALAAIGEGDLFPAVVVCPASVKVNWQREAATWLPDAVSHVVNGRKGDLPAADLYIVNYDLLPWRWQQLERCKAVVFDEAHNLKNPKSKRTRSAYLLVRHVDHRMMLSGTPVLNAPHELISQLGILGVLDAFGGQMAFCNRYCPIWRMPIKLPNGRKVEIEKHGAKHLDELNLRLREVCMIRRMKSEVLADLPPKQRAMLWLSGSADEMKAYRAIEREDCSPAVKLGKLRQQLGIAKVADCLEWLEDQAEPVVIWVHHRNVGEALTSALQCPSIRGGMTATDRQAVVDRFQAGKVSRIVCSIQAAGVGLTLTAASNALFVEQAWTPALLEQAEDRCHRIGQTDSVTAWYAAIQGTIDELIFDLLKSKRAVIEADNRRRQRPEYCR